jgi:hypothetical protein
VLRIVFAVVSGASLIGLGVSLTKTGLTGPEFLSAIGQWFGGLISGLIAAFGNITLIFAIIERTKAADKFEKEFKEWDPKELKSEPDPDQIDLPDHIATIIFTALGLVVFNLYPNLLAVRYPSGGNWVTLPILTEAFFRFLPWINILGLFSTWTKELDSHIARAWHPDGYCRNDPCGCYSENTRYLRHHACSISSNWIRRDCQRSITTLQLPADHYHHHCCNRYSHQGYKILATAVQQQGQLTLPGDEIRKTKKWNALRSASLFKKSPKGLLQAAYSLSKMELK